MKTEERTSQTNVQTLIERDMFEDDLKQDTGSCLLSRLHDCQEETMPTSVCNEMENEITKEGTNEGQTKVIGEHSEHTIESVDACAEREKASEEEMYVDCRQRFVARQDQPTHYAEILTSKPCSSTVSMARRTRESSNPILRLHYDQDVLETGTGDGGRHRETKQDEDECHLYENMGTTENFYRPKIPHSRSDSEITYANIGLGTVSNLNNSPLYENYEYMGDSRNVPQGNTLNETSDTESLYEDIDDVYEAMSPRSTTKPISIVYTSIDFSSQNKRRNTPPSSTGSCSVSSSLSSLERSELTRCSSCCSTVVSRRPPELPQRTRGSLSRRVRPNSVHYGNRADLTEFGLYTGTLVGSCSIMKNSPKSVKHIIADFLAREKRERSKPVSLEVNNEFLRLSLNCAPWSLLAQNAVDDIGCVTTASANNKTALGYTISRPGEDSRCYVIHCSGVDTIKEAILSTFKKPDPSLSRWSSMNVLGRPSSGASRSLPRMKTSSMRCTSGHNELAVFDDLVYLGSYKVKKSYLIVSDNITTVLDNADSKQYAVARIELYKDAIHLKDSKKDRILDIHQLEWILSMGLFDEDRRYFGYISSKAFQGSKTRTFCHVFRCSRVGLASRILETIRTACQATFLANTLDYNQGIRPRANSTTSTSSEGSMSSSSENTSLGSTGSSPPEIDGRAGIPVGVRRRPRVLEKKLRSRMSTIRSFAEDEKPSDILEEKAEQLDVSPIVTVHRFTLFYLISTIVSPPLKPKHVKNCLKQFQKSVDKEMKKSSDREQQYKKVQLVINQNGITIVDELSKTPQAFFEKASLSGVHAHPDGKCAFSFSTVVSGNTKHKCHLFLQDKEPMDEMIKVIQSLLQ